MRAVWSERHVKERICSNESSHGFLDRFLIWCILFAFIVIDTYHRAVNCRRSTGVNTVKVLRPGALLFTIPVQPQAALHARLVVQDAWKTEPKHDVTRVNDPDQHIMMTRASY